MNNRLTKQQSHLLNNSGIALPLVLMLLVVFTVVGTAAYTASQSSLKQATRLRPNLQAEYLARSALDATIAAWTDRWINQESSNPVPTSAHFYTKYNEVTDKFEPVLADGDGVIETNLTYDTSLGICTITATADVGTFSKTVTAVSEPLITISSNATELNNVWYENRSYLLTENRYYFKAHPTQNISDTALGIDMSYHYTEGTVNFNLDKKLYLMSFDDYFGNAGKPSWHDWENHIRIGIGAKKIIFNNKLDLNPAVLNLTKKYGVRFLVVCAETINFNKAIYISDNVAGALMLKLPEGAGISGEVVYQNVKNPSDQSKVALNAYYGIVSFSDISILGGYNENKLKGKTFYFRHPDGLDALPIGLEENLLNQALAWLGLAKLDMDFSCNGLINNGFLIEAKNNIKTDYQVLFVYQ